MASKAQIGTIACVDLGGKPVSDIDNETSKEANLLREYWDITRDEVMSSHLWNFAKKWKALALDSGTIIDPKWDYAYQLPNDYLKLSKEETEKSIGTIYEIRQDLLYINLEDVKIEYIFKVEDTSKWPVWFITAMIARLRSKFQIPLSKKGSKTTNWYQIYLIELEKAKSDDASQGNPSEIEKGNHTNENDTWIQSNKI